MTRAEIEYDVLTILREHFNVNPDEIDTDAPLEVLSGNFRFLEYLVFLEQLLNRQFEIHLPLLEHINTEMHSLRNIVDLVLIELNQGNSLKQAIDSL